ncbi:unnamed protein product [Calicophoron daubneyi]|uniref:Katanin p60 ATPase-containing subunit A-like 2 n=1 Tax=Calicophoron daubneyi TaxID=300641 RepID=A0AAV2SYN2_CALDB
MEYESYYFVKFNKYPRITKKIPPEGRAKYLKEETGRRRKSSLLPQIPTRQASGTDLLGVQQHSRRRPGSGETTTIRKKKEEAEKPDAKSEVNSIPELSVEGRSDPSANNSSRSVRFGSVNQGAICGFVPLNSTGDPNTPNAESNQQQQQQQQQKQNFPRQIIDCRSMINQETRLSSEDNRILNEHQERLLKPLGGYAGYTGEWRDLAMTISREIFLQNPNVRWDDIIGLGTAKRLVKEAVVYPIKYPQLFAGILSPWKGFLLYGPPGTGKTLLAKAVATECNTTFFNISASTIVSKWRGDSEKLVRVLFELARFHAPSTIFLDELDSLMSQRGSMAGCGGLGGGGVSTAGGGGSEHEGSRRMKTELLMQMDGLAKSDDLVFLLAASNLPWELDHAMLRRLEKRILVDLPNTEARKKMFETFLPPVIGATSSGGLQLTCHINYAEVAELTEGYSGSDIRLVCKEAAMRVVRKIFDILENHTDEAHPELHIRLDPVLTEDVKAAISTTMPSARQLAGKYQEWQRNYGCS